MGHTRTLGNPEVGQDCTRVLLGLRSLSWGSRPASAHSIATIRRPILQIRCPQRAHGSGESAGIQQAARRAGTPRGRSCSPTLVVGASSPAVTGHLGDPLGLAGVPVASVAEVGEGGNPGAVGQVRICCRSASATACARSRAPSFRYNTRDLAFTVSSERSRCAPISRLDRPWLMPSRIPRSPRVTV